MEMKKKVGWRRSLWMDDANIGGLRKEIVTSHIR